MQQNRHTTQPLQILALVLTVCLLFVSGLRAQNTDAAKVDRIQGEATLG